MKEILVAEFLQTYRKLLSLWNMIFYQLNQNIMASMVLRQALLQFHMAYSKVQSFSPRFGPLLFLIYINDLNQAIKFCKVHHLADDTNLLHFNKSVVNLNKLVNQDMKNLTVYLNANIVSLNVEKTEIVIFKHLLNLIENNFTLLNLLDILVLRLTKI